MDDATRNDPRISAAAERQMQVWALAQQVAEQSVETDEPAEPIDKVGDFITISRESGAWGSRVAELVGNKLGWAVLDKNLLDQVAAQSNLARAGLDAVDETRVHWADGILGTWLDPQTVPHHQYVHHLRRIVTAAARDGRVVFVGRGAQFLLPPNRGLSVRIIAPEDYRVAQIVEQQGLSAAKARHHMVKVDRGRREFVRRFFDRDIDDPHLYDLVLNVARFGPDDAADKIVRSYPR